MPPPVMGANALKHEGENPACAWQHEPISFPSWPSGKVGVNETWELSYQDAKAKDAICSTKNVQQNWNYEPELGLNFHLHFPHIPSGSSGVRILLGSPVGGHWICVVGQDQLRFGTSHGVRFCHQHHHRPSSASC